ncbi:MAG TPA: helix-turn-helix transcriptional regulator [Candidatus Sulfotelmatobacter sp.]|jgi:transcriptional regulator with XRE-family HTH domain|nr:helix-turn-helix transcriptional regulator [Candidatus Sulfotelmatobacter sp.]
MASIYEKLGNRIKSLRKKADLSQEELAEKAKIDLTSVSEIESGLRNPSLKTIHKIALALKVSLQELFS